MARTIANQFPKCYAIPRVLAEVLAALGWKDISYGNDIGPSFEHRSGAVLWCECKDRRGRETSGARYTVVDWEARDRFASEDTVDLIAWLHRFNNSPLKGLI